MVDGWDADEGRALGGRGAGTDVTDVWGCGRRLVWVSGTASGEQVVSVPLELWPLQLEGWVRELQRGVQWVMFG